MTAKQQGAARARQWRAAARRGVKPNAARSELCDAITGAAREAVADELGKWLLLRYTTEPDGTRTLEQLVGPDDIATETLRRMPDGTLEYRSHGRRRDDAGVYGRAGLDLHLMTKEAKTRILRRATKLTGHSIEDSAGYATTAESLWKQAWNSARDLIDEGVSQSEIDGNRVHTPAARQTTAAKKIMLGRLIKRNIVRIARAAFGPSAHSGRRDDCTIRDYNWVIRNRQACERLYATAPTVLIAYCQLKVKGAKRRPKLNHPGQAVTAVKRALNLTNGEWRAFATGWECDHWNPDREEEAIATIRRGTTVMAQAGPHRRELDPILCDRNNLHKWASQAAWAEGSAWDGWIHIVQRWAASDTPETRATGTKLSQVADAFRWHVEQNLPWRRGTWEQYTSRSARWHANKVREARERQKREVEEAVWSSEIDQMTVGRTTVTAITDGKRLAEMGSAMRNCLGSYWPRCVAGTSRIFVMSRDGQTEAAGELHLYMGRWEIGQVEGMRMRRPPSWARAAMQQVRDEYRRSWEEREERAVG